ncbi:MAG TPA: sulfatase-like hydrolase/transferase, partial [Thermoanaerobaculia bacterium]|nr:sulfatase-like hydrolase/transferase [Thermoanaerobaculia bacterium]
GRMRFRKLIALAALAVLACNHAAETPRSAPPDIILITIDTLRADALGYAGQREVETPFLDQLARESIVVTNAHSHNVVTLPSHTNILTGLYPYQHGVRDNAGYTLDPKYQTVAALLKQKGYATGAFVGAFPLDARYGLTPGFDVYDDKYPEGTGKLDFKVAERPAEQVLMSATQWWSSQTSGPRFMWIHVYDPHAPYAPPGAFASRYEGRAYLGEVAYVDSVLSRYIAPLLQPQTMVIVTADHGEALGDHGEMTHGLFAYEATLKVPLLVRAPAAAKPRTDDQPARHIDIVPTILEQAGIAKPDDRLGLSLLQDRAKVGPTYFEALSASLNRGWAPLVGVIEQGHKYIDLPLPELYDLAADKAEGTNLFSEKRRVTTALRSTLAASAPKKTNDTRAAVSPDQTAQLLSLGYLTGSTTKTSYTAADDPKKLVEVDNMLHRMIELYQRGRHDDAIATAKEVVALQPDMPIAREMLAFMLQESERSEAGIETLQQAVERGTATDAVKIRLGLLLSESGRAQEAVAILAPFANKSDVEILNAYGIALADVGRHAEAIAQFQRVHTIDATNATAYQNLGIVALRSGQVQLAEQYLDRAPSIDRELPLALNTLGVVYVRTGRTDRAIETWRRAVAIDPRLYDALFNLAVVSGQNARWDIARNALKQFIATAPPQRYGRELASAKQMLKEVERRLS